MNADTAAALFFSVFVLCATALWWRGCESIDAERRFQLQVECIKRGIAPRECR